MKKIALSIPEDLDNRLRKYVEDEFKSIKGSISIVGIKALESYLSKNGY